LDAFQSWAALAIQAKDKEAAVEQVPAKVSVLPITMLLDGDIEMAGVEPSFERSNYKRYMYAPAIAPLLKLRSRFCKSSDMPLFF